jgi:hypothetical protein
MFQHMPGSVPAVTANVEGVKKGTLQLWKSTQIYTEDIHNSELS